VAARSVCICCGATALRLTDEHVVPHSPGGVHMLENALCFEAAETVMAWRRVSEPLSDHLNGNISRGGGVLFA
jgi:hypothetical protein